MSICYFSIKKKVDNMVFPCVYLFLTASVPYKTELAVFIRFLVYRRITIEYGGSTMVPAEAS